MHRGQSNLFLRWTIYIEVGYLEGLYLSNQMKAIPANNSGPSIEEVVSHGRCTITCANHNQTIVVIYGNMTCSVFDKKLCYIQICCFHVEYVTKYYFDSLVEFIYFLDLLSYHIKNILQRWKDKVTLVLAQLMYILQSVDMSKLSSFYGMHLYMFF